jgi:uncharacterized protein YeaO (DUF488 family)
VSDAEGVRILVDRIWPRELSKENANIHFQAKDEVSRLFASPVSTKNICTVKREN